METSIISAGDEALVQKQICFGCNSTIDDRYLSKVIEQVWHDKCIRCCECHVQLSEKCFSRNSKLYCKQHFHRTFGVRCAGCEEGIYPSDLVRRIALKIFHISCLKCRECQREVSTGDQIYKIHDGSFVCKKDYENMINGGVKTNKAIVAASPPLLKQEQEANIDEKPPSISSANGEVHSDDEEDSKIRRGPRTTIKAKQLDILKSAFLTTPKPSRHIREKLAQDTGLSMRVIQVWFQNRRSKERRVKQLPITHDIRTGCRKNGMDKDRGNQLNYRFFQNGTLTSGLEDFTQRGFSFDQFNNNNNNSNNNNNNALPLSLPIDEHHLADDTQTALLKSKYNGDGFAMMESFTSQLQSTCFNDFHNMVNFPSPVLPSYGNL